MPTISAKATSQSVTTTVTKADHWFNRIDWANIQATVISRAILIAIASVLFFLLNRGGKYLIRRIFSHYENSQLAGSRFATVKMLILNIYGYVIIFFYLYTLLSILGIPVGTLLAGAGIVGIAVGLGAQGFISDIVNGFFIILEGQLDVGDSVKLGDISGTVRAVGLRTTQVVSSDGTLNYIPNRNITIVQNLSRNAMISLVDLPVGGASDSSSIETVVKAVNAKLVPEEQDLIKEPELVGLVPSQWGNLVYQVRLTAKPGTQAAVRARFLTAYVDALQAAGIAVRTAPSTNKAPH
ncbi:mechanosensitive ion channel family protein [Lacticaseibacillus thailandensis]|uniref:mechanosensitive ion channel family protein n=1 Tax=Lacticaseibacillus thailandensis TaxID=381741 RepID=UPI000704F7FC|nr:mechanosensitive ion channel family protein [Lacticaseibacillus thailandensis]